VSRYRGERIGSTFEILVAVFMAALAATFIVSLYLAQMKRVEEGVLRAQLRAFRMQQRLFTVVNGRGPRDLKELVNDSYSLFPLGAREVKEQPSTGMVSPEAVMSTAVDEQDHPVDPWGNRYVIDPVTGRIHSVTKSYEDW
jgi:type II secretory pathway pseudopilin PulG